MINAPQVIDIFMKIIKPVLRAKLVNRVSINILNKIIANNLLNNVYFALLKQLSNFKTINPFCSDIYSYIWNRIIV